MDGALMVESEATSTSNLSGGTASWIIGNGFDGQIAEYAVIPAELRQADALRLYKIGRGLTRADRMAA
jgi:hypothetical protein